MTGTATIVRSGGFDDSGDPVPFDEESDDPGEIIVRGCAWAPRFADSAGGSGEVSGRGREGVIVGLSFFAPIGTPLRHTDTVLIEGIPYEVEGEPGVWASPISGTSFGIQAALRRAEG